MPRVSGRNTIDWSDREKSIISLLGLKPTMASGAGWMNKEDGQSDVLIAQLKSTQSKKIGVLRQDVLDLIHHARITHKKAIFVLDFVDDETLVCCRVQDIEKVAAEFAKGRAALKAAKKKAK